MKFWHIVKKVSVAILPHVILITAVVLSFGILMGAELVFAQLPGGGILAAVVLFCTCGPGYLTVVIGEPTSTPSGLFLFAPWTVRLIPTSGFPVAWWLGSYVPGAGVCLMNSGPSCFSINGHLFLTYGGSI